MAENPDACRVCHRLLRSGARFCSHCGTPRGGTEPPAPSPLAGLRRRIEDLVRKDLALVAPAAGDPLGNLEGLRHGPAERHYEVAAGHRAGGLKLTLASGGRPVAVARLLYDLPPLEEPAAALLVAFEGGSVDGELAAGRLSVRASGRRVASLELGTGRIEDAAGALLGEVPPIRQGGAGSLSPTVSELLDKPRRWPLKIFGAAAGSIVIPPQEGSLFASFGAGEAPLYEPLRPLPAPAPELRAAVLACAVLACAAPDRW